MYKPVIVMDSQCWSRTHAHVKGLKKGSICKWKQRDSYETLRSIGFSIRRKEVNKYRKYIKMTYERGLRRGLKKKLNLVLVK